MTTLADFKIWLKTPQHIRRLLVEISDITDLSGTNVGTVYLSNGAYTSTSTDTPANKSYVPCIVGGLSFVQTFSPTAGLDISYGDIEINNVDGRFDTSYLNYIWTKKPVTIYLGDPGWSKSDFKVLFRGLVGDIFSRDRGSLSFSIVDKLEQLNTALSEDTVLQETKNNILEIKPICFGESFNVSPLINQVTSTGKTYYIVHNGAIEDIIEVRDMGAPITGVTKDLANGRFELTQSIFGQLTCSVQGDKTTGTYTNTAADIIKNIVKNYGPSANRFTDSDIDLANFSTFNTANTAPVGFYSTNRENLLDVCNKLADSIRAKLMISMGPLENDSDVGKLRLIQLNSATSSSVEITSTDIEEFSLSVAEKIPVRAATKIAYCKNYTVQSSGLAAGLPAKNIEDFASEYYYVTNINNTTKINYKATSEPIEEQTYLITKTGASAEANTRNSLWSSTRYVYTMTGYPHLFDIQIGDFVKLTNRRFNLSQTLGTVVRVSRDWISGRVELGVLV